ASAERRAAAGETAPKKDFAALAAAGRDALEHGDALRAVDLLGEAAQGMPRDVTIKLSLALALESTRQLGPAADTLLDALDIDDADPRLHLRLGIVYAEMGKPELASYARKEFAHALDRAPTDADRSIACYQLGLLDEDDGKPDDALASYRAALAADPSNGEAANNAGLLLANAGKNDEAIALYRKAVAARPTLSVARLNLGLALLRAGDSKAGRIEIEKLLALPETDPLRARAKQLLAPH
ncbi:MAG TPA: tetratricopeptide repeat protein, partial [bacterium]|nr:tetratricopeptide repeat protein [bacterium]